MKPKAPKKKVDPYSYAERMKVNRAATAAEARRGRAALAEVRRLRALTKKERTALAKEWKARAKAGRARAREALRALRAGLRAASKATSEIARYVSPGARVVLSREEHKAINDLAAQHAAQIAAAEKRGEQGARAIEAWRADTEEARRARKRDREERERMKRAGYRPASRAAESAAELEDAVRNDLASPDEVIVFEHARKIGALKPNPRMTPTEVFYQWVHDHAGEIPGILADHYEREADRVFASREDDEEAAERAAELAARASGVDDGIPF